MDRQPSHLRTYQFNGIAEFPKAITKIEGLPQTSLPDSQRATPNAKAVASKRATRRALVSAAGHRPIEEGIGNKKRTRKKARGEQRQSINCALCEEKNAALTTTTAEQAVVQRPTREMRSATTTCAQQQDAGPSPSSAVQIRAARKRKEKQKRSKQEAPLRSKLPTKRRNGRNGRNAGNQRGRSRIIHPK